MRKLFVVLFLGATVTLVGCNTEQVNKQTDWAPLKVNYQGTTASKIFAVKPPLSDARRALRVSTVPQGCLIVSSAVNVNGEQLITEQTSTNKSLWRTSKLYQQGMFVLEGTAAEVTKVNFKPIACDPSSTSEVLANDINVEMLVSDMPANPGIKVRFALSSAIAAEINVESLSWLIALELDLSVAVTNVEIINDAEIVMQSATDISPLVNILSMLKSKNDNTIDIVIGQCLKQHNAFGLHDLAGFTPRIPGGVGMADGIFVSRTNCDLPQSSPGTVNEIARLTAHEIGHYLGLTHPIEANGTEDDLTSTDANNLMHRIPLTATAKGLTSEQRKRMLAHPYVIEL
ncbi:zinc-dependent metalloprotease family protein [Pseudoalteromonas sp. ASV78]|uniref:zinc-dependent metalloprotease family protein n=1 Tax=Pseudoalteromonas sp. ASV78 TaxID=3397851 RepID=UPI0039FC484E